MELVFIAFVGTVVIMASEMRDFVRRQHAVSVPTAKTGSGSSGREPIDHSSTGELYDKAA